MRLTCPKCARARRLLDTPADTPTPAAMNEAATVNCTAAWHRYYDNAHDARPKRIPMPVVSSNKPRTVSPNRVVVQPNYRQQPTRRAS